jgi:hypothetical protein
VEYRKGESRKKDCATNQFGSILACRSIRAQRTVLISGGCPQLRWCNIDMWIGLPCYTGWVRCQFQPEPKLPCKCLV